MSTICSTVREEMRFRSGLRCCTLLWEKTLKTPFATKTMRNWNADDLLRDLHSDARGSQYGRHFHQLFR